VVDQQMLDEVGTAQFLGRLIDGARPQPQREEGVRVVGHLGVGEADAVRQRRLVEDEQITQRAAPDG